MSNSLKIQLLSQLSETVAAQTGLHFPQERWPDLERGLGSAARVLGFPTLEAFATSLLATPLDRKGVEVVAGELTVGETYFFREKRSLEIFSEQLLPEIARTRRGAARHLRLWSAGCCSGEEPYTLAILLDRFLPDLAEWRVTILGTDINPRFLHKAAGGIYNEWSFRDAPPWLKTDYFKPVGKKLYEIIPRIKNKVTFAYLNLAEDAYPSLATNTNAMDFIFCRNVMMYFNAERTKKVVHQFRNALVDQGWLVVSLTETSSELFRELETVPFPQGTFYRKSDKPSEISKITQTTKWELKAIEPAPVIEFPPHVSTARDESPLPAPPSFYEKALVLFEQGKYSAAAEILKTDSTPKSAKNAALLSRIYANLGDLTQAMAMTDQALALDKLDAGVHYLRAVIFEEQGAKEEALSALKKTLYLDPHFVLAHFALGNAALRRKHFPEAERHFVNVLNLLADYETNDVLPQSDGLVAGRLREMVAAAMSVETAA
jgi:chemotaxis protein methyltransferase CheR